MSVYDIKSMLTIIRIKCSILDRKNVMQLFSGSIYKKTYKCFYHRNHGIWLKHAPLYNDEYISISDENELNKIT